MTNYSLLFLGPGNLNTTNNNNSTLLYHTQNTGIFIKTPRVLQGIKYYGPDVNFNKCVKKEQ